MEALRFNLEGETLEIHVQKPTILISSRQENLTEAEWKIIIELAKNSHLTYSREALLVSCLGSNGNGSMRTIDTHVKNIRRKIKTPGWIKTVRQSGYRFNPEASPLS